MQIHIKPSKTLLLLFVASLLGGCLCIFCSRLSWSLQFLGCLVALGYGGQVFWENILLRSERAVVTLICCDDNTWQLKERSGETYPAVLGADSIRKGYFCLLRFKTPASRRKRSCVVFRDAVPPETYRRLLMKLNTMTVRG